MSFRDLSISISIRRVMTGIKFTQLLIHVKPKITNMELVGRLVLMVDRGVWLQLNDNYIGLMTTTVGLPLRLKKNMMKYRTILNLIIILLILEVVEVDLLEFSF